MIKEVGISLAVLFAVGLGGYLLQQRYGSTSIPAIAPVGVISGTSTETEVTTSKILSREELCKIGNFTKPLKQEVDYNSEISKDTSDQYLRLSIDDFLTKNYVTTNCSYSGQQHDGRHCADGAYDEAMNEYSLTRIDPTYLKSKFIVLSVDQAPGGGK